MRYAARFPLEPVLFPSLLLIAATVATEGVAVAQQPAPTVQDTLVGAVRSVDYQTNTVELLTGVAFAIRVERVHVEPPMGVTIEGESRPLADLRRGQVVRVAYREMDERKVATSLEVVPPRSPGGAR